MTAPSSSTSGPPGSSRGSATGTRTSRAPRLRRSCSLRKATSRPTLPSSKRTRSLQPNIDSFHFHGETGEFPITALLLAPPDQRSETILRGRWEDPDVEDQLVVPRQVIADLLETILTIRSFVLAGSALMAIATFATAILVFWLSLRLRAREISTLHKIGGSRRRIFVLLASEAGLVLALSIGLSTALVALVASYAADIVKTFLT